LNFSLHYDKLFLNFKLKKISQLMKSKRTYIYLKKKRKTTHEDENENKFKFFTQTIISYL